MVYSKRIPPIKLVLTVKEYNYLIGILNRNIMDSNDEAIKTLAELSKEKLLKYSIPKNTDGNKIEIETRLYINEASDLISQLLAYLDGKLKEINYYQVLLKIRESTGNIEEY